MSILYSHYRLFYRQYHEMLSLATNYFPDPFLFYPRSFFVRPIKIPFSFIPGLSYIHVSLVLRPSIHFTIWAVSFKIHPSSIPYPYYSTAREAASRNSSSQGNSRSHQRPKPLDKATKHLYHLFRISLHGCYTALLYILKASRLGLTAAS